MLSELDLKTLENKVDPANDHHGYFGEAVASFRSGAFRSCAVMMQNAVISHAYRILVNAASVNGAFEKKLNELHVQQEGKSFEKRLAETLKELGILEADQAKYMEELREFRNGSAHPDVSEIRDAKAKSKQQIRHHEAAYLVREGVELFLSRPSLSPLNVVEDIVLRVKEPHYFTSRDDASCLEQVTKELSLLPSAAYERLVERIARILREDPDQARDNAILFLCACVDTRDPDMMAALGKKILDGRLNESRMLVEDTLAVLRVIDRHPQFIDYLDEDDRKNLDFRIARVLESTEVTVGQSAAAALNKVADIDVLVNARAALKGSLPVGLYLLSNPATPHAVRRLTVDNAIRALRTPLFRSFVERNMEAFVAALHLQEVFRFEKQLFIIRVGGSNGRNFTKSGECRVPASKMEFEEDEKILAELEDALRQKLAAAQIAFYDPMARGRRIRNP